MLTLNFDLHTHSRFSADGVADPIEMVRVAKEKGLQGFAITDHNTPACIDFFMNEGLMRPDGLPVDGLLIIPGQEITTSAGHLLALGVHLPDLKGISPAEAVEIIHEKGGLAIPAHPYDFFRAGIKESIMDTLDIDAVEVFNAATSLKRYNQKAYEYAGRKGLPMTAGSDAHHCDALGVAYTVLHPEQFTLSSVLQSIRNSHELCQNYMSKRQALKKTWNNVFRLKRKKHKTTKASALEK